MFSSSAIPLTVQREVKTFSFSIMVTSINEVILITQKVTTLSSLLEGARGAFGVIRKIHCGCCRCCQYVEGLSTVAQSWTGLEIPKNGDATDSLGNLFRFNHTHRKNFFFLVFKLISYISICDHCLLSCYWAPLGKVWLYLLCSPIRFICTLKRSSIRKISQTEAAPDLSAFLL